MRFSRVKKTITLRVFPGSSSTLDWVSGGCQVEEGLGGLMNSFLAGNSFLTPHLFAFNTGREEINAKVLQALENEALKVRDVSQYFCQAPTYSAEGQIRFLEKIQIEFYIVLSL